MKYVLLILVGGTGTPLAVLAVARALVERSNPAVAREARIVGHLQVANAEARRAATQRTKESVR
ncbi:hypothetical protein [Micromonospora sp. NPDC049274]|uniref:hypothetical protein n=1 Tax=Micromonospora sp. NPDC049274 TaxID=3154829 RepID=UPI003446F8AB